MKGELSAQLTEGSRLGKRPSLAAGERILSKLVYREAEPLSLGFTEPAPP